LGFGLIAAVSGNAFISTVSSSAITDMKDENKKVKDDLKEVKQKFVPHEYLGVELDRNDADSWPKDAMEYINPCDDEINILKSIAYKCYTLRTFKGIAVAIGYYDNDVLSESKIKTLKCHLETLTDLKYLSLHECRDLDGIPRYSITKFGIKFLSEYEHGHAKDVATYYEQHKYLL